MTSQPQPQAQTSSTTDPDDQKSGSNGVSATDKMAELFGVLQPYIEKLIDLYGLATPYIEIGKKYFNTGWSKIEPFYNKYWSDDFIELFIGLTLLFFGGQFAMTIACYMAIQISGWDTIKNAWSVIKKNYNDGMIAFQNDPDAKKFFDTDGDGKISGKEIGSAAKMFISGNTEQKKAIMINLKCVFVAIDPQQVMSALGGLWAVSIAVIATLRSTFAKDIALGVSLGNIVSVQISRYAKPIIKDNVDKDLQKWADFLIDSICRMFGISLALILVRIVSAFHSAIKGGQIFALFILKFLNSKQMYNNAMINNNKSNKKQQNIAIQSQPLFLGIQYGLALTGFWWQLSRGFALNSIFLRFVLLPFSICEWILTWFAAY